MAGYGGQFVALNVNTPSESQLAAAQASTAQTQSQVARATAPFDVEYSKQRTIGAQQTNQDNAMTLTEKLMHNTLMDKIVAQRTGQSSPLAAAESAYQPTAPATSQNTLLDPRVEEVMRSVDPSDPAQAAVWDAKMLELSKEVPQAAQFIGHGDKAKEYREAAASHGVQSIVNNPSPLAQAPAAVSPLAALGQTTSPDREVYVSPVTGKPIPAMTEFAIRYPKEAAEAIANDGMMAYNKTGNPVYLKRYAPTIYEKLATAENTLSDAQKTALVTQQSTMGSLGQNVLTQIAQYGANSPEAVAALRESLAIVVNHKWMAPLVAQDLLSRPIDQMTMSKIIGWTVQAQTVSQYMDNSGQKAANEAKARAPYTHSYSPVGNLPSGNLGLLNSQTGEVADSGVAVSKQSAGAITLETKIAGAKAAGYNDKEAYDIAVGIKPMAPDRQVVAARGMAIHQQDLASINNPGQPFDIEAAYRSNLATIQNAGAPDQGGSPSNKGGNHTQAQRQAYAQYAASKSPFGSADKPYIVSTVQQALSLPQGSWFIAPDGRKLQNKARH